MYTSFADKAARANANFTCLCSELGMNLVILHLAKALGLILTVRKAQWSLIA